MDKQTIISTLGPLDGVPEIHLGWPPLQNLRGTVCAKYGGLLLVQGPFPGTVRAEMNDTHGWKPVLAQQTFLTLDSEISLRGGGATTV